MHLLPAVSAPTSPPTPLLSSWQLPRPAGCARPFMGDNTAVTAQTAAILAKRGAFSAELGRLRDEELLQCKVGIPWEEGMDRETRVASIVQGARAPLTRLCSELCRALGLGSSPDALLAMREQVLSIAKRRYYGPVGGSTDNDAEDVEHRRVWEVLDLSLFPAALRTRYRAYKRIDKLQTQLMQQHIEFSCLVAEDPVNEAKLLEVHDKIVQIGTQVQMAWSKAKEQEEKAEARAQKIRKREAERVAKAKEKEEREIKKKQEREEKQALKERDAEEMKLKRVLASPAAAKVKKQKTLVLEKQFMEGFFHIETEADTKEAQDSAPPTLFPAWQTPADTTMAPIFRSPRSPLVMEELNQAAVDVHAVFQEWRRQPRSLAPSHVSKWQLIDVHTEYRPAFFGPRTVVSSVITGRRALHQDPQLDYSFDSDDEWEDEEPGESLSDNEEEDEEEEDGLERREDGLVEDGWLMPEDANEGGAFRGLDQDLQLDVVGPSWEGQLEVVSETDRDTLQRFRKVLLHLPVVTPACDTPSKPSRPSGETSTPVARCDQ